MTRSSVRTTAARPYPADCWYAVVSGDALGRQLTSGRALDTPVALYRTADGQAVALEDRCAHRPFPLSKGRRDGDNVSCGLCGFVYGPDGACLSVPTQARVPVGARVRAFPTREYGGVVWVWFGEPAASTHRLPELPWLAADGWDTVRGEALVRANFLLLHESFADVTKVPVIAPDISPAVLHDLTPPLDVVVTETTVSLYRTFPPGRLPAWQLAAIGPSAADVEHEHVQEGHFLSPAVWADHWDARVPRGPGPTYRMRFTQFVTPVTRTSSRLRWRVSRDFGVEDADAGSAVQTLFDDYYATVASMLGIMQDVLETDGPRAEVNVSADVAALKVRAIVSGMVSRDSAKVTHLPATRASSR